MFGGIFSWTKQRLYLIPIAKCYFPSPISQSYHSQWSSPDVHCYHTDFDVCLKSFPVKQNKGLVLFSELNVVTSHQLHLVVILNQ